MFWVPGDHFQAEDRIHRIGQEEKVQILYLQAREADIDVALTNAIEVKASNINAVIDGGTNEDFQVDTLTAAWEAIKSRMLGNAINTALENSKTMIEPPVVEVPVEDSYNHYIRVYNENTKDFVLDYFSDNISRKVGNVLRVGFKGGTGLQLNVFKYILGKNDSFAELQVRDLIMVRDNLGKLDDFGEELLSILGQLVAAMQESNQGMFDKLVNYVTYNMRHTNVI